MPDKLIILYVDDDPDIRSIATMSLELDPDITVYSAPSAVGAVALLEKRPWKPDAIMLDVMMPGMDGLTLAAEIRRMPELENVPLLFITARAREPDLDRFRGLGVAGVITKPFDPIELAASVRAAIAQARLG